MSRSARKLLSRSARETAPPRTGPFSTSRLVALTAALAGGVTLVVPGVAGLASEPAATVAPQPSHLISSGAVPAGPGLGALTVAVPSPPAKPKPKPKPKASASAVDGGERASRSTARAALRPKASAGGSPRAVAQAGLSSRGWSGQFSCLDSLWKKESGWRVSAANASGAYGIPQALPGRRMASAGSDWRTNPATQIEWGLDYISTTYGSPCAAWSHSRSHNWY